MFPRKVLRIAKSHPRLVQALSTAYHAKGGALNRQHVVLVQRKNLECNSAKGHLLHKRWFASERTDDGQGGYDSDGKTDHSIKEEVLDNALKYVPDHGWTRKALAMSANELGYPSVAEGMVQRGGADLVLHFVKANNKSLVAYMEQVKSSEEDFKVPAFIQTVLERRLRMLIPFISVWPQAMATLLQPSIVVEATEELGRMVDDIWYHAGDQSTDFNWYTKRGLLAKLFISTQMVMIKDQSPDFRDTWEFLDRRMNDIATFTRLSRSMQEKGRMVADIGVAGFTVMSNIIGIGERRR